MHHANSQRQPGTDPSAGAKWNQLEVATTEIHLFLQEPLRDELVRLKPHLAISANRPNIHHNGRALGHRVASDLCVRLGSVREQQRRGRMEPESLFHDGLKVLEAVDVGFVDFWFGANHSSKLLPSFHHG
ncbi:Os03g0248400 [Oryza sativa Japonica Group]|uniref:Os03g0248400 protein n=1 Tax=Oryza sativa subsp. japonica TaxID=39947 RepID=A0A0P0VVG6_ORYSJ|nr:hypothetical protein EE612_016498 [Oryza sativa]BAS83268.1 Os03g0248400 [Oryza sativa Japonica Group]